MAVSLGLTVSIRETDAPAETGPTCVVSAEGHDQPGIVDAVSTVFSERGVSVVAFESRVAPAPYSGAPMYHINARVVLPGTLSAEALQDALGSVAQEFHLHVSIEAAS